jgi:hypothetical protein
MHSEEVLYRYVLWTGREARAWVQCQRRCVGKEEVIMRQAQSQLSDLVLPYKLRAEAVPGFMPPVFVTTV